MLKRNKKKQIGGVDVVTAALNMADSMDKVRDTLRNEMNELGNFSKDFNNASQPAVGVPNQTNGPPKP
jgi:hypothetical protein